MLQKANNLTYCNVVTECTCGRIKGDVTDYCSIIEEEGKAYNFKGGVRKAVCSLLRCTRPNCNGAIRSNRPKYTKGAERLFYSEFKRRYKGG